MKELRNADRISSGRNLRDRKLTMMKTEVYGLMKLECTPRVACSLVNAYMIYLYRIFHSEFSYLPIL